MAQFDKMKKAPYLQPPADYEIGADPEEDTKYTSSFSAMNALLEEIQKLEEKSREGN